MAGTDETPSRQALTLIGVFEYPSQAQKALGALKQAGYLQDFLAISGEDADKQEKREGLISLTEYVYFCIGWLGGGSLAWLLSLGLGMMVFFSISGAIFCWLLGRLIKTREDLRAAKNETPSRTLVIAKLQGVEGLNRAMEFFNLNQAVSIVKYETGQPDPGGQPGGQKAA